jgi:hypothetical protein
MVADYKVALEEIERTRMMSILGLPEICRTYEREKAEFDATGGDAQREGEVQTYWARAELAKAEIDNGHPAVNAQALIGLNSALDALVEQYAPAILEMPFRGLMDRAEKEAPEAAEQLTDELRENLLEVLKDLFKAPKKLARMTGSGTQRYEERLSQVGLGAPEDRPIPDDLDQALTEIGAIRDVLIHRAGRIDGKAKTQAPTLPYEEGQFVRLSDQDYRTYSAAIRCYGWEIVHRSFVKWIGADAEDGPDLGNWREHYIAGA